MTRPILIFAALACTAAVLSGCALVPVVDNVTNGQVDAAADSAAKANVLNAKVAFLTYTIENGQFPDSIDVLYDNGYEPMAGSEEVTFVTYSEFSFCIEAVSDSGATFSSTDEVSVVEGACD